MSVTFYEHEGKDDGHASKQAEDVDHPEVYQDADRKKEHDKTELAQEKHLRGSIFRTDQPLYAPGEAPYVQKSQYTSDDDTRRHFYRFDKSRERGKGDQYND